MTVTTYFQKLIDYTILNAYSLKDIGFYNGKAGISLSLFEMANYLQDEKIEEHAFELLQESLVLGEKKNNIRFESGLSGIGFVLLYLIQNKLIDADFNDLFEESQIAITSFIEQEEVDLNNFILCIHFLASLYELNRNDGIRACIAKILKAKDAFLEKQINLFDSEKAYFSKHSILNDFTAYLKITTLYRLPTSYSLIEKYCNLFDQGKIPSLYEVAYYLDKFRKNKIDGSLALTIERVIKANEKYALKNMELQNKYLTLSQRINCLFLLNQNPEKYRKQIALLERHIFNQSDELLKKRILFAVPGNKYIPGYESGIARLLLYGIYRELKKEKKEVERFKFLFC